MTVKTNFIVVCKAKDLLGIIEERLREEEPKEEDDLSVPYGRVAKIGVCRNCSDDITTDHDAYCIDKGLIHSDCLYEYMERYKV